MNDQTVNRSLTLIFLAMGMIPLLAAPPANDQFSNAAPLSGTDLVVAGTNVDATKQHGEPSHGANSGGKSVWWVWTAPGGGSVVIRTDGSTFDTLLAAYTGTSVDTLSQTVVGSNDDAPGAHTSIIGFNVVAGVTYSIAVDGYDGASGTIQLALSYKPSPLERPANDAFASRIALSGYWIDEFSSNLFASRESDEPIHASAPGGASVWWTWTAPVSGIVNIGTTGTVLDTLLSVYTGSVLSELDVVAESDDLAADIPTSVVSFDAIANTTYAIAVDGFDGEPGNLQLHIAMEDLVSLTLSQPESGVGVHLVLAAPAGYSYLLEKSTDLATWSLLATLPDPVSAWQFTDPATTPVRVFYRARIGP